MNLDIFSNKDNIEQEYILKYFFLTDPIALAKVSIKDPHPEEQASFNIILFIALFSISKHLIS